MSSGKEYVMVLDISFGYPRQPIDTSFGCKLPELEEWVYEEPVGKV